MISEVSAKLELTPPYLGRLRVVATSEKRSGMLVILLTMGL